MVVQTLFPIMKSNHLIPILSLSLAATAFAQQNFDNVTMKATHMGGTVHMLEGAGGNIGVSAGNDGILIIDTQFAPLAEKIEAAVEEINSGDIRYVLNTHWHPDHTGSNPYFGKQADIIAHDNVRVRLSGRDGIESQALPTITYAEGVKLHMNGESIQVHHFGPAHTDGDSIVWFPDSDVVHLGDLFFNGRFPFIDLGSGGSAEGYLKTVGAILEKLPEGIKIIPGHGPAATREDYVKFHTMLKDVLGMVKESIADGKSLQQVKETGVQEKYKSWSWAFINESRFLEICYNSLSQ